MYHRSYLDLERECECERVRDLFFLSVFGFSKQKNENGQIVVHTQYNNYYILEGTNV